MTRTTKIAAVLSVAVVWFVVGMDGWLTAHNAIYHYSGLRLLDGVPPYVSIFDMKTPLASFVSAGAIALGGVLDLPEIMATRVVFGALAASVIVPIYLTSRRLFDSDLAGFFSVLYLLTITPWLWDISAGPRPQVLATTLVAWAIWFMMGRKWVTAALAFGAAALTWQPALLGIGGLVAGAIVEPKHRWSRVGQIAAGAAAPFLVAGAYFVGVDALSDFLDGALLVHPEYVSGRAVLNPLSGLILLTTYLQETGLWMGLFIGLLVFNVAAVFAGTRDRSWRPFRATVVTVCGFYVAWSLMDIQAPADVYVLLPFAAAGVGGLVEFLVVCGEEHSCVRRRVSVPLIAAIFMLSAAATGVRVNLLQQPGWGEATSLEFQKETVAEIQEITGGEPATVIGATEILSLTRWTNPTRHVVINSGIDRYIEDHYRGGFRGWTADVLCGERRYLILGRTVGSLVDGFRSQVAEQYRLRRSFPDWQLFYPEAIQTFGIGRYDLELWIRETSSSECRTQLAADHRDGRRDRQISRGVDVGDLVGAETVNEADTSTTNGPAGCGQPKVPAGTAWHLIGPTMNRVWASAVWLRTWSELDSHPRCLLTTVRG